MSKNGADKNDKKILGEMTNKKVSNILEWIAFVSLSIWISILFVTWSQ